MTPVSMKKVQIASYNCRGWKSAANYVNNLFNQCDICMLQEHWLTEEQLHLININDDFLSTGVSGMVSSDLITGRPYGGCAILFRKSLSALIVTLKTNSIRLIFVLLY